MLQHFSARRCLRDVTRSEAKGKRVIAGGTPPSAEAMLTHDTNGFRSSIFCGEDALVCFRHHMLPLVPVPLDIIADHSARGCDVG
jgi:hypothetical protein